MSKRMSLTKFNYEIYDKKLFIIIKTFEKWRSKCVDTSIEYSIKIFTNHQNLKYFMTSKNFNKKQTRWIEFLFEFNFVFIYRFDKQNTKFDNFTKKIENLSTNKNDERKKHNHKRLLKKKHFDKKMKKIVELTLMLLNESSKKIIWLIALMYDLNEKKSVVEKLIEKLTIDDVESEKNEQKINEELFVNDDFNV